MNKQEIYNKVIEHKVHITTVKAWDAYAKKNNLPPSVTLIYHFGSWNGLKKALDIPLTPMPSYSEEELKNIILDNKELVKRKMIWDENYKERGLPSSSTLIKAFDSWTNIKEIAGYSKKRERNDLYSQGDIKKVLLEHADNYENRKQWDVYAKEHRLPTYKTIRKHFDYDQILKIVNEKKKINFTKDDLIKIAREHKNIINCSMKSWDSYASENQLPSSYTFINKFGTWRKAKHDIALKI